LSEEKIHQRWSITFFNKNYTSTKSL